MSNDDIERRLEDLEPVPPREGLREDVLGRVQAELDASAVPRIDRFLGRRTPWIAAAAVLLVLLGANALLQRAAAKERAERRAAIEADARSVLELRAWMARLSERGWP